jgi:hypothetical protein
MRFLATPPVGLLGLVLDEPLDDAHVHAVAPVERHHRELGPVRVVDHGLARGRRPRIVHLVGVRCFDKTTAYRRLVGGRGQVKQAERDGSDIRQRQRRHRKQQRHTMRSHSQRHKAERQPETTLRRETARDTEPRDSQRQTAFDTTPSDRQPETLRRETDSH